MPIPAITDLGIQSIFEERKVMENIQYPNVQYPKGQPLEY
jgi:hypothetical protein